MVEVAGDGTCNATDCLKMTPRAALDMPLSRKSWIDSSVTIDTEPAVRSGALRVFPAVCTLVEADLRV